MGLRCRQDPVGARAARRSARSATERSGRDDVVRAAPLVVGRAACGGRLGVSTRPRESRSRRGSTGARTTTVKLLILKMGKASCRQRPACSASCFVVSFFWDMTGGDPPETLAVGRACWILFICHHKFLLLSWSMDLYDSSWTVRRHTQHEVFDVHCPTLVKYTT